jgi:hypothetical protein
MVDPCVDCRRPETPEFAYLNACDLPAKNHALESARVDSEDRSGGVTVQ